MPAKLTVLIPCRNEAANILACIESVRGVADEILVADSLSTDETLEIVRRTGCCRIIEREFVNHADFKNWAIPQAAHPWVLVVDADERMTAALAAEIREILNRDDPSKDAYCVRFQGYFLGHPIRHCGWNRSTTLRLFRRDVCRYGPARVHELLQVSPDRVGTLRGKFLHYTARSLTQWTLKQERYAAIWAEDRRAAGRRTSRLGILIRPVLRFLQLYVIRGGFLDGTPGLILCMSYAFYTYQKYANLWQLQHGDQATARPNSNV